ncbi:MAG: tetratricopeptide repeat protein, partial [Myxococcota bacterium]
AQRATTLWTELVPDDPVAWRHHASVLYSATPPEKQDAAFRQLLEDSGNTPAAHVVYAGYLTRKSGFRSGLEYLRGQLTETPGDAPLLVAIVALQQASGRLRDSAKSLAKLEQRFPDDAMLPLSMAQQALLSEDYDRVEAIISEVPSESRTAHLYRILARVQLKRHLDKEALKTLHTATALSPGVDPESLRLKAQIYLNLREYRKAASTLARVAKVSPLSPREQAVRGGSYYDARMPGLGRTILSQVLEREPGNTEVALELYRREGTNPHHWDFLRKILEQALDSNPDNRKILTALTRLDLEAGQVDRALARVEEIIGRANWVGYPYLVRARIYLVTRRLKLAAHDAKRALLLDPKLVEESFEMEARAYLASGDPSGPITALEEAAREGRLSADRLALLARLRLHSGNPQRALAVYEQALAQGSQLNHVKNDLAVLLAESKNDLERAEALALAAVEAPGEQINAIDTLGYVYLAQGLPDAAYWKFRYAIANAETPNAEYHYHLALALVALQREAEAREALAVALELDPRFEPARDLHTRLRPDPSAVDNPSAEAS